METASVKSRTYEIDSDLRGARQGAGRGGQHEAGSPAGQQQADEGGAQRQQDAFRQ